MGFAKLFPGRKGFQTYGPNRNRLQLFEWFVIEGVEMIVTHGGYEYAHAQPHEQNIATQPEGRLGRVLNLVYHRNRLNFGINLGMRTKDGKKAYRTFLIIEGGKENRINLLVKPTTTDMFDTLVTAGVISLAAIWNPGNFYQMILPDDMPFMPPWMANPWGMGLLHALKMVKINEAKIKAIKAWGKKHLGKHGILLTREAIDPESLPIADLEMLDATAISEGKKVEYPAPCETYGLQGFTPPEFTPDVEIQKYRQKNPKEVITNGGIMSRLLREASSERIRYGFLTRIIACALYERDGGSIEWEEQTDYKGRGKKKKKLFLTQPEPELYVAKLTWEEVDERWAD